MTRLIHLSDLHFGKDRPDLLAPLLASIDTFAADLVIISGDLTQRARRSEYREARAFIDRIASPVLCVPGNHDIPIHRPFTRFFAPWRYYRRWISNDLTPVAETADALVIGLNSVDRFRWQTGRMSWNRVRKACRSMEAADAGKLRIMVTHHPLNHPSETKKKPIPGAAEALDRLIACGADMVLSGHLHIWHAGMFAHRAGGEGKKAAVQLHAGTSLSSRVRGEPNDFNLIDIGADKVAVERISFDEAKGQFEKSEARTFERAPDGILRTHG